MLYWDTLSTSHRLLHLKDTWTTKGRGKTHTAAVVPFSHCKYSGVQPICYTGTHTYRFHIDWASLERYLVRKRAWGSKASIPFVRAVSPTNFSKLPRWPEDRRKGRGHIKCVDHMEFNVGQGEKTTWWIVVSRRKKTFLCVSIVHSSKA